MTIDVIGAFALTALVVFNISAFLSSLAIAAADRPSARFRSLLMDRIAARTGECRRLCESGSNPRAGGHPAAACGTNRARPLAGISQRYGRRAGAASHRPQYRPRRRWVLPDSRGGG